MIMHYMPDGRSCYDKSQRKTYGQYSVRHIYIYTHTYTYIYLAVSFEFFNEHQYCRRCRQLTSIQSAMVNRLQWSTVSQHQVDPPCSHAIPRARASELISNTKWTQFVQFTCLVIVMLVGRLVSPACPCATCVRPGSRRTVTCVYHGLTAVVEWAGGC